MLRELFDKFIPPVPIFWRGHVGLVPERMQELFGRQFLGREAQLNERPYAIGQQAVVNLIDVGKVIDGLALLIFVVQSHFVMKDGVKANVLEARDLFDFPQVLPVAFAQTKDGTS